MRGRHALFVLTAFSFLLCVREMGDRANHHKVQSYLKFLHVAACTLQTITVPIRIKSSIQILYLSDV